MHIKGSAVVIGALALGVAGCGSSKHSATTSSGTQTADSGTATAVSFARVAAPSNTVQSILAVYLPKSGTAQLSEGMCDVAIEGPGSAKITGASVRVSAPGVSTRVTSIHVSPRYASSGAAWKHVEINLSRFEPSKIHSGYRLASGAVLRPGFYNVVVQADIYPATAAGYLNIPAILIDLQSGASHMTLSCPKNTRVKFVKP